jgi:hypothetical protein
MGAPKCDIDVDACMGGKFSQVKLNTYFFRDFTFKLKKKPYYRRFYNTTLAKTFKIIHPRFRNNSDDR